MKWENIMKLMLEEEENTLIWIKFYSEAQTEITFS